MDNILITGANGQLGSEIRILAAQDDANRYFFTDIDSLDICRPDDIDRFVAENGINLIINCAAYTDVEKAEDNKDLCTRINAEAPRHLAQSASRHGAGLIHISTDYVFDGHSCLPYREEHPCSPQSVYGETKALGERYIAESGCNAIIIRTAWLYSEFGKNFVKTMLRLSKDHDTLTVVDDQIGSPTYTPDIARLAVDMILTDHYGTYHVANQGLCTWYEFAKEIFRLAGREVTTLPVSSEAYAAKAKRPHNSRMDLSRVEKEGFEPLPSWQDALERYLKVLPEEEK